jgi:hypothetical protein
MTAISLQEHSILNPADCDISHTLNLAVKEVYHFLSSFIISGLLIAPKTV